MFKKVHIENFRCFRKLNLEGLKTFNLIIGKNNIGKTALLEALFLHGGSHNPGVPATLDGLRAVNTHNFTAQAIWSNLFYNLDTRRSIRIQSSDELSRRMLTDVSLEGATEYTSNVNEGIDSKQISTDASKSSERLKFLFVDKNKRRYNSYASLENNKITYKKPDSQAFEKGMFISTRSPIDIFLEAQRFGKLQIEGKELPIIESLKMIEPNLKRIMTVPVGEASMVFADIGLSKAIEINYLGEGVLRLLQILLAIAETENGTIFIDEIERGFHYSFYESALKVIGSFAEQIKSQIFATTHSNEFLISAYKYYSQKKEDNLAVIRLDKKHEEVTATQYNIDDLEEVYKNNWEIR